MGTTYFDQRGQQVQYQYNATGGINFSAVQKPQEIVLQLQKLVEEIAKAAESDQIDKADAVDARSSIEKAIIHAKKPQPEGGAILRNLEVACSIVEKAAATAASLIGLVAGLKEAVTVVTRLFQ